MNGDSAGQALARRFYERVILPRVAPVLDPLPHAAALLGDDSEVLGFDDAVSTDHDFGPRLQLFLPPDVDPAPVLAALEDLPERFDGFPTAYRLRNVSGGQIQHQIEVTTAAAFFTRYLTVDPAAGMNLADWLLTPTQTLATLTSGPIFADPAGLVKTRQAALAWYPDDIWRYVLAAGWLPILSRGGVHRSCRRARRWPWLLARHRLCCPRHGPARVSDRTPMGPLQ